MTTINHIYKDNSLQREVIYEDNTFPFKSTIQKNRIRLVRPHWHSALEIVRILKGPVLCTIENQSITAYEGDILFFNSYVAHSIFSIGESNKAIHGITFAPSLLEKQLVDLQIYALNYSCVYNQSLCYYPVGHPVNNRLNARMQIIEQEFKQKAPFYQMNLKGLIYQILSDIYRFQLSQLEVKPNYLESKKKTERLAPVFSYIEYNYATCIELKKLSQLANMSTYYFNHYFKEIMGISPMDYLTKYRIHIACSLLSNTNDSITNIAQKVGYNTVNYFNRVFKSAYGITPSQYRKKL